MTTFFLIIVWLIVGIALWGFAINATIEGIQRFKYYEFKVRSIFYWLAVIFSLIIGILIG